MSGNIIGSSSDEEEERRRAIPTSTPYMSGRKKTPEFDASIIAAPESNASSTLNCTILPSSRISNDKKFKERHRPAILSSSSDEDDDDKKSSSSVRTILGTPSSSEEFVSAMTDKSAPFRGPATISISDASLEANAEPISSRVGQQIKTDVNKQKFQFRNPPMNASTTKPVAADQQDTVLIDDLVSQVSEINLEKSNDDDEEDELTKSFGIVQLDDSSEIRALTPPPPTREPPRSLSGIVAKIKDKAFQPPRQVGLLNDLPTSHLPAKQTASYQLARTTVFLPETPAPELPVTIPFELRAGVGSLITKLQKTITGIPRENDNLGSPRRLAIDLYAHQMYGLTWLWWREKQEPFGGILADEMGLGKTVMILALICRGKADTTKENLNSGPSSWATNSSLVPSRATLVVCPASVMGQWEDEIKKKTTGLKVLVYHGPNRTKSAPVLSQNDIILTTFNTLGSDIPKLSEQTAAACTSPLIRLNWERIVLDEGHIIRNPKTCGAQAACRLSAKHRWIVTGTPVHNKPSDMYSLVKFLRLTPFDDHKVWEAWIGMKSVKKQNAERLNTVARALLLRRTKDEVMCDLQGTINAIPPKTIVDVYVDLKEDEQRVYEYLNNFATKEFRAFIKSKEQRNDELQRAAQNFMANRPKVKASDEKNFAHIFVLILRLRQCSVLPFLIHTMLDDDEDVDDDEDFDPEDDLVSMKNPVFGEEFKSAKLERLYQDLHDLKRTCREAGERMEKVVIVSQWTSLLKIVGKHLDEMNYSHVTISGDVKIGDRMDIMSKFNNNPSRPQVMLLSLAAGGVGLNLIGANHLFLLDIHWNPQLELQAQDRIHRFGQRKPVTIHRYISRNTMEERVMDLQKSKLELADGILNTVQQKSGGGLRLEEMRQLFGL